MGDGATGVVGELILGFGVGTVGAVEKRKMGVKSQKYEDDLKYFRISLGRDKNKWGK